MNRGILTALFVLTVFLAASPAFAEKIAFVDVGKVFDGYGKTKEFAMAINSATPFLPRLALLLNK